MLSRIIRVVTLVLVFSIVGTTAYFRVINYKGINKVNYVSPYTYKEYDKSGYEMNRDKINIGIYDSTLQMQTEESLIGYKELGGDFIIHGGNNPEFMKLCEKYGMGIFPAFLNVPAYNTNVHFLRNIEPVENLNDLGSRYDNYGTVWGDLYFDEPSAVFFDVFQKVVDIYRTQLPTKMPIFNLHPMNVGSQGSVEHTMYYGVDTYQEYIDSYCSKVDTDYICFDVYPFNNYCEGIGRGYLLNIDIVASACRESGRDFWIITQAGGNEPKEVLNKAQLSWQAYLSLAYGAVSIIHASYTADWWDPATSFVNRAGEKNDLWESGKALNTELHALSDTFMDYKSTGVFTVGNPKNKDLEEQLKTQNERSAAKGITEQSAQGFRQIKTDDAVLVGCFDKKEGEGSAMMLVNMVDPNTESEIATVTFKTTGLSEKKVTAYIEGVPTVLNPTWSGVYTVSIKGGEGVFVTVE